jgi:hypothetical protein
MVTNSRTQLLNVLGTVLGPPIILHDRLQANIRIPRVEVFVTPSHLAYPRLVPMKVIY